MIKRFFLKYIDKKKLYTDLFRLILVGVCALIWNNRITILEFFNIKVVNWLAIIFSWKITIPIVPTIFLIGLLIFSSYLINLLIIKKRIKVGTVITEKSEDWIAKTNNNLPQGATYKEILFQNKLFSSLELEIIPRCDYIRFGIKLLEKNSEIMGSKGVLTSDNNFFFHIGKQNNDFQIHYTTFRNGIKEIRSTYATDYVKDSGIKLELNLNKDNSLTVKINRKEYHLGVINPHLRERIAMIAWGDGYEYDLLTRGIKVKTIE